MLHSRITHIHDLFNQLQRELTILDDEFASVDGDCPIADPLRRLDAIHHDVQLAIDNHIEANDLVQTVAGNYRPRVPITD